MLHTNYYLPISAKTTESLKANIKQFISYLQDNKQLIPADLAYTASVRRIQHNQRILVPFSKVAQLPNKLAAYLPDDALADITTAVDKPKLVMVFSGMGQQFWSMGRALLEQDQEFCKTIKSIDTHLQQLDKHFSIYVELLQAEAESQINDTCIAQCSIFALQVGVYEWLQKRGITPDAVVGHSVGEAAAAYVSGALSLTDALKVVHMRSKLQATTAGNGAMLAVGLGELEVTQYIKADDDIAIAAINSPTAVTVAGNTKHLERLEKSLTANKVFAKFLKVEVAYHSQTMEPILAELENSLSDIQPQATTIPLISTVTGSFIEGKQLDSQYWCQNIRQSVQFNAAIDYLLADGYNTFLEISAHPVLKNSMHEILAASSHEANIVHTLQRKQHAIEIIDNSYEKLFQLGVNINWQQFFTGKEKLVKLPHYAWLKQSYWNESDASRLHRLGDKDAHELLGNKQTNAALQTWQSEIDIENLTYLADHKVQGKVYFPAAGFIEVAMAAANEQSSKQISLTNISIHTPLVLTSDAVTLLQTIISGKEINIYGNWKNY